MIRQLKNLLVLGLFFLGVLSPSFVCADDLDDAFDLVESNNKKEATALVNKENNSKGSDISKSENEKTATNNDESEVWLKSLFNRGMREVSKIKNDYVGNNNANSSKSSNKRVLNKKSNAINLDIAGIRLRMTPEEVQEKLKQDGYVLTGQEYRTPNFIKWRIEDTCRLNGVVGFENLEYCVNNFVKENGYNYIASETYYKQSNRENIVVFYTSIYTKNLSFNIKYSSDLPLFNSKNSKHVYINNLKKMDFWQRVDLRYGEPDNKTERKWGLGGGNMPYLQADTGTLELMDPILKNLDASRMFSVDSKMGGVHYFSF